MRTLLRASLVLALTLPGGCRSDDGAPDPERALALHREFALRYYDQGELLRAEQQVEKGLEIAPDDRQLRLMRGWIRQRRGSAEDVLIAEEIFRELAPKRDYRALLGLAEALERKGVLYWESAAQVESGRRATTASDRVARAAEMRATAQASWRESVEHYRATLEIRDGEVQAINGLQRVHALLGELEESLVWSRRLLEETQAEAKFWRLQLERPDITAEEERRLRDLLRNSQDIEVQTHLQASSVLVQLDRSEEALANLTAAAELAPDEAEIYSRRAQILSALGRPAEAATNLEHFLRISPLDLDHPDMERALELLARCERSAAATEADAR